MATISDGDDVPQRYRAAQRGLTRELLRDLRRVRRLLRGGRLQASLPEWLEAVQRLVEQHATTSAALAADVYDLQRVAAGARGPFVVPVADPPPEEQSEASLRWATSNLWPRDPDDPRTTGAQREPLDVRLEQAHKRAEAVAQKLVADTGRDTIQAAVREDRQAAGWARAAALGACSFCKLMATRGAVYESRDAAGREANARFEGDGEAKYHDHCHCVAVPVFAGQTFELSPHAREWERLYQEYAAPYPGDQLRRFRRALAEHSSDPLPAAH